MGRTFPNRRANAGPDQNSSTSRSSSGRCALSHHLAEDHPQVLIIARRSVESAQYTSLAFTDALRSAGIAGSIGTVGDALDNALMESTIGLYKTELIDRHHSFTGRADLEHATAEWVHWYTSRLHSALGHRTPLEHEQHYHHHTAALAEAA